MIQIYTGDGKGKTTASLGLILRAVACGMKVAYVQFDKGGKHYSERKIFAQRFPEVDVFSSGLDRMEDSGRFRFGVSDEDKKEGGRGLEVARKILNEGKHDLVVLDELNVAVSLGIIDEQQALELLKSIPKNMEVVITGRNAPASFIELADLATDMKSLKHYFYKGVQAREGLDY